MFSLCLVAVDYDVNSQREESQVQHFPECLLKGMTRGHVISPYFESTVWQL